MSDVIKDVEKTMSGVVEHTKRDFATLHVGGARADFLDTVSAEVYGSFMPMKQIATVNVVDNFSLLIVPFDSGNVKAIVKAIQEANFGVGVIAEGNSVRVTMPKITEDRRKEYVKILRQFAENGKTAIRSARRDANYEVDKLKKDQNLSEDEVRSLKKEIQNNTDRFCDKIDEMTKDKEKEILNI